MAIAIDREEAGNIENPSFDVINFCIEEHKKEIPRLQMLFDYYKGKPHKESEQNVKSPHDLDEVNVNNAKYVVDMMTGFTVGSPISYTAAKNKNIDKLVEAFEGMRIKKHDKELEKGLSTMGIGYELQYLAVKPGTKNETIPKIAWIDPRGMFTVVDDTVERNTLFAVRHRKKRKIDKTKYWEVNVYTSRWIHTYYSTSLKLEEDSIIKRDVKPHYYQMVPIVEFRNNEEKQGDFEQQLSQIDKYNELQTNRIKDKENFVKAIMFLFGFGLPDDKPAEVNGQLIVEAPSKEDGGDAAYLTNTFQESEVQVLADALISDFHKTTYVPNMNDENFMGNVSGEAMKYKLFGLLLIISIKVGYLEDGILQRLQLTANILNVKGQNVDVEGTTIKFKPHLPVNRSDIIKQIGDSQEFIPLLISLGWLDDIDNPQEILDLLQQQKEKDIELAKKAIGQTSSHNNIDDEPEEDEDDNSDI
ncbi:phage portal protein [Carnobacterium maltaromaticum]|uniref:phage portal protein n=1 Tax=Carnobacterium maltaromaticum TaxID=2751 RepID=UPI001D88E8D8|nr:phage portal protein [Carnobacterium maltaromaticum]MCC4310730.1 phage portal protein [Carnobacterium maltaromaticum]